jgi:hypothetical protein
MDFMDEQTDPVAKKMKVSQYFIHVQEDITHGMRRQPDGAVQLF